MPSVPPELNISVTGSKVVESLKQYKCGFCLSTFNERKNLNKHMRLKHKKEWDERELPKKEVNLGLQHKCDVCEEYFSK